MKNRYIQFSYRSEKPKVAEKGISFKKLFIFAIIIFLIVYAMKNGVDKDTIKALILNLLK
jgi:hypothetical protein